MQAALRDPLTPAGLPMQRGHARARLSLPARLVTFSGARLCTLVDLSCTGARIATEQPPRVGAMVVVEGLPLELFGTVRWTSHAGFGIAFDQPLTLEHVVAMRRHADSAPERAHRAYREDVRRWVQGVD